MQTPDICWLDTCKSTNAELSLCAEAKHGYTIATVEQSAGRGQRGNTWESEPGANLTFSTLLRPAQISAARQFELSMIVSFAVTDVIDRYLPDELAMIKWPNDIYVADRKICGILIENTLCGTNVERSIVGIGLNVNQQRFYSDAPNPVSMIHFRDGQPISLRPLLKELCTEILNRLSAYESSSDTDSLKEEYMSRLWRGDGERYPFKDMLTGEVIEAAIADVALDGQLTLVCGPQFEDKRTYLFKEVAFI